MFHILESNVTSMASQDPSNNLLRQKEQVIQTNFAVEELRLKEVNILSI